MITSATAVALSSASAEPAAEATATPALPAPQPSPSPALAGCFAQGLALMDAQDWPAACEAFTRGLALDAQRTGLWHNRAWCYLQMHNLGAARADLHAWLRLEPANATALGLMGRVQLAQGDVAQGVQSLERAWRLAPDNADIGRQALQASLLVSQAEQQAANLALELAEHGHLDEPTARELSEVLGLAPGGQAIAQAFWRDLCLQPGAQDWMFEVWARFCEHHGRVEEAAVAAGLWRRRNPTSASARDILIQVLAARGDYDAVLPLLLEHTRESPDRGMALGRMAELLFEARHGEYATTGGMVCNMALALEPDNPALLVLRASLYNRLGEFALALADGEAALVRSPGFAPAFGVMVPALAGMGRFEQAQGVLHTWAAQLNGVASLEWLNVCALYLRSQGKLEQAGRCLREALHLRDDSVIAVNLAHVLLGLGDYAEGFVLLARRKVVRTPFPAAHRALSRGARPWDGNVDAAAGRSLLVTCENGIGDTFQFVRFLPALLDHHIEVILHEPRTGTLLRSLHPRLTLLSAVDSVPAADFHCDVMDLPGLLNVTLSDIERWGPAACLQVAPDAHQAMAARLGPARGLRVGLAWRGTRSSLSPRSIELHLLAALDLPGIEWFSLQDEVDLPPDETQAAQRLGLHCAGWSFDEVAAALANMDLIVSVDTVFCHLAGALGLPVLIPLPMAADWRWGHEGDSTPWYPKAALFRQTRPGDWSEPLARVAEVLREQVRSHRPGPGELKPC